VIAGTGHPYKYYRSQGHRLSDTERPIIIAGPIMNHAAEPRPDSRPRADKQRDGADDRTESFAVKQIRSDGGSPPVFGIERSNSKEPLANAAARMKNAARQPYVAISRCVRGTTISIPKPIPEAAIPIAIPRLRINQFDKKVA
jgi:hypothetical protein